MRPFLIAFAAAFALPLFAAPVPKEEKTTAEKLVGVWKLTKSDVENAAEIKEFTIEFAKGGKLVAKFTYEDSTETQEGKWKADGDKIEYTLNDRGETLTIRTLTDDKLGVTDPDKKKEDFERVKAEKDEKKEGEKKGPEKKSE